MGLRSCARNRNTSYLQYRPSQDDRYIIPAVVRALRILESFSLQKPTYTNAELSRKLDLNKSSVTRLLYSLEKARFVKRDQKTGEYRLTHKTYQVGRIYINQVNLHTESMPLLKELTAKCNETSHLAILDEMHVFYLDWVESTQSVSLMSVAGNKLPSYCTAIGKILLAYMDAESLNAYFRNTKLSPHTANTITNSENLKEHLQQIRAQGYAIDDSEFQTEVKSVAGPVMDESGNVVAGISIAGPVYRMDDEVLAKKIIPEVKKTARKISKRLGWTT